MIDFRTTDDDFRTTDETTINVTDFAGDYGSITDCPIARAVRKTFGITDHATVIVGSDTVDIWDGREFVSFLIWENATVLAGLVKAKKPFEVVIGQITERVERRFSKREWERGREFTG